MNGFTAAVGVQSALIADGPDAHEDSGMEF
jgi:hypothetical protein